MMDRFAADSRPEDLCDGAESCDWVLEPSELKHSDAASLPLETMEQNSFFPLFIDMRGRNVIFVGGGRIAQRRVEALLRFGAEITVISPELTEPLRLLCLSGEIRHLAKRFEPEDLKPRSAFLVIAATNDREANRMVMQTAEQCEILAIISDCREECGCCFPAMMENSEYIAGLISKTGNHAGVRETAKKIRSLLNDE